ncbi:MAG: N-6 DNA methylase [Ignavibacteria bacterium]|jgi:hypothetical protein
MGSSVIKTNERELAAQVKEWFNEIIKRSNLPFKEATVETGIRVDERTKFADLILWKNRETNEAYTYIELKPPFAAKENLATFREKASQLKVNYAYTWDFQNLTVYCKKDHFRKSQLIEDTPALKRIDDWLRGDVQATIKSYISRLCDEIVSLNETGILRNFKPEPVYFVNFIRETINKLIPLFEDFVNSAYGKRDVRDNIKEYMAKQGYSFTTKDKYIQLIAKQRVYGLVTKLLFYLTIKRYFDDLPDIYDIEENDFNSALKVAFNKAQEKDWQPVFSDDIIEELGTPKSAYSILRDFFSALRAYHFENLPDDVIGELFELTIETEQRHDLGQYFTNENLVDLIIGAVVQDKDGYYCDPTCGSGTFLIRLYDRLQQLNTFRISHNELLDRIWGFDIGKFPSELSTINLFRQSPKNFENFPRVVLNDIFEVSKGRSFSFPPPNAGINYQKIEKKIPEFYGIVGNFPYIRQELIEKESKGYKTYLTKVLAEEYLFTYLKLFDIKNITEAQLEEVKKYEHEKRKQLIHKWIEKGYIKLRLSGQADIYAYIFIHTAILLSKQGSFGIITSNSWLDVSYGSVLKEFFLDHFKVKMIIASWAEPWFEEAAINTVITVLEKEENSELRDKNNIKFVKLKKKLIDLIPYQDLKLQRVDRWKRVDDIIGIIENAENVKLLRQINEIISSVETDELRIRIVKQKELRNELEQNIELAKWGKYLRAPDVYFEILDKCKNKLVPLKKIADVRRGYTTGINDFFYLEPVKRNGEILYRNGRGWEGKIEEKYLKKVIKSPKDSESINIDSDKLKNFIFICNKSKQELKKIKNLSALAYIEWGEKQSTEDGTKWKEVPSVKEREYWWSIDIKESADIIWPKAFNDRFLISKNVDLLVADRFYELTLKDKQTKDITTLLLNSTIQSLIIEINGRINLGEGALDNMSYEAEECYIINPNSINNKEIINKSFDHTIKPIEQEIKQKERINLDTAILKSLGLNPKEYLDRIYAGLCEMVRERLELPKMRKLKKKQTEKKSFEDIKESVIEDCIPDGVKKFPASFYILPIRSTTNTKSLPNGFENIKFDIFSSSALPIQYEDFLGHFNIKDAKGKLIFTTDSINKAEYAYLLSRQGNIFQLKIPKDDRIAELIVENYHKYVDVLKDKFLKDSNLKLHDWALSENLVKEIFEEYRIYDMEQESKSVSTKKNKIHKNDNRK